jgi:hypothetical protein
MDTPRFRIRWWHWLIASVLIVSSAAFVTGYVLRCQGRAAYQAVLAAERAAGHPGTIDAFIDALPPVDSAAQEAWFAWQEHANKIWTDPKYDSDAWDLWLVGQGPRPALPVIETQRPDMLPACELLRRGNVLLSARGWLAADCPPGKRTLVYTSACRLPNLLACRTLADWLRHDAVLAADPSQSLADLDALVVAMRQPGSLIDAMIAIALEDIRAHTYLELALRGTLPEAARAAWLAEPVRFLPIVADGFASERVVFVDACAQWIDQLGPFGASDLARGTILATKFYTAPRLWATGHRDCAFMARIEAQFAARLRGERSDPLPAWATLAPEAGYLANLTIPNLWECPLSALTSDALQYEARLAVRLLLLPNIPADQIAAATALGDPNIFAPPGDHLALRYERLADDHFSLALDPAATVPTCLDAAEVSARVAALSKPPTSTVNKPLRWNRAAGMLEVTVPKH